LNLKPETKERNRKPKTQNPKPKARLDRTSPGSAMLKFSAQV
jgi:hypothetical protein